MSLRRRQEDEVPMREAFEFIDPGELIDGDLRLVLMEKHPENPVTGWVPYYEFHMVHVVTGQQMGLISLRVGNTPNIVTYGGHIGYNVKPEFRGHHYAARSCKLLLPLAKRHGLDPLWITVTPDNHASRRTCEILGCEMVEIVDLPPDSDMYAQGERQKCRYRLINYA